MACNCSEKQRPLADTLPEGSNERPRQWVVLRRNVSCSAFNGYREQWSDKSDVMCRVCGAYWRSSGEFVHSLPDCEDWPEKHPERVPAWGDTL